MSKAKNNTPKQANLSRARAAGMAAATRGRSRTFAGPKAFDGHIAEQLEEMELAKAEEDARQASFAASDALESDGPDDTDWGFLDYLERRAEASDWEDRAAEGLVYSED